MTTEPKSSAASEITKKAPAVKTPTQVKLYNKLNQDVIVGSGFDAVLIPPRGLVTVDSALIEGIDLPAGIIKQ